MNRIVVLFPFIIHLLSAQNETYRPDCRKDLGMQSRAIPDSAITASSSYDEKSVGPINARIRTEKNGGAWCPKVQISRDVIEWLQIDLGELKVITLVETQGRFGNGQGQEYAPNYMLEYQRQDEGQWIRYADRKGSEILKGNSNTYIAELRELYPPIIARKVRFVPYSNHPRTTCIRVELYGCSWTGGVIMYEMKQGSRRGGGELDFSDFTYDGHVKDGYLSGGLGQLTDGEEGNTQFRLDLQFIGKRGFEWIAWKNDNPSADPVEIIFRFDHVRNFSAVRVHTNNLFSKEISLFRAAHVFFSVGGHYYGDKWVEYNQTRDVGDEQARYVTIPVPGYVGRHVKLVLFFDTRWIMISEVQFISDVVANGSFVEETEPPLTSVAMAVMTTTLASTAAGELLHTPFVHNSSSSPSTPLNPRLSVIEIDFFNDQKISTILPSVADTEKDSLIGILLGTFGALFLLSCIAALILIFRYRKKKCRSPLKSMFVEDHVNFNLNYLSQGGKFSNGNIYNSIATNDLLESANDTSSQYVKRNDIFKLDSRSVMENKISPFRNMSECLNNAADCKAENVSNFISETGHNSVRNSYIRPNNIFPPPCTSADLYLNSLNSGMNINELPAHSLSIMNPVTLGGFPALFNFPLRFVEKLGEGRFGEVHICAASDLPDKLVMRFRTSQCCHQTNNNSLLVALLTLRKVATEKERLEFEREIRQMTTFTDQNVVQTLGVCRNSQLTAIVVEYTDLGCLHQFLRRMILPEDGMSRCTANSSVSHGCLIYIATQIASGMKYLESLKLVHRDLATRNCLIGHQFNVKINDFGTARVLYPDHYHEIEGGITLPLRWMSWEAAILKKFTCKSDVWSFGVTLWEIVSFARILPFDKLSNEQVINNLGHYYHGDGQAQSLSQPAGCPKEIYDLMNECCSRDEFQRPTFREIHMFLSRKNNGYNPQVEHPTCCSRAKINSTN